MSEFAINTTMICFIGIIIIGVIVISIFATQTLSVRDAAERLEDASVTYSIASIINNLYGSESGSIEIEFKKTYNIKTERNGDDYFVSVDDKKIKLYGKVGIGNIEASGIVISKKIGEDFVNIMEAQDV